MTKVAATIRSSASTALLVFVCACGPGETKSERRTETSESLPTLAASKPQGPKASGADAVAAESSAESKDQLPWHALDKCGIVDVLKQPDGGSLGRKKSKSLPFDAVLALGRLRLEAKLSAALSVEFFTDRVETKTTIEVYEASPEVMAASAGAGEFGLPWVLESVSWLPDYFDIEKIQTELGWDPLPCSFLPIVKREDRFGRTVTVTEFAPGFPGALNASLGLEVVRGELGEGRKFPAVAATRTVEQPGRKTAMSALEFGLEVNGGLPTGQVMAALALEGDADDYFAYELTKTATGAAATGDTAVSTAVFDAESGASLGSVVVLKPKFFAEPLVIGFPAFEP